MGAGKDLPQDNGREWGEQAALECRDPGFGWTELSVLTFFLFLPPAGDFAFSMRAPLPQAQWKWITLSWQQWQLLILLVDASDNFFFRSGRGSKCDSGQGEFSHLSFSCFLFDLVEILAFISVASSSYIRNLLWAVVTGLSYRVAVKSSLTASQICVRERI